MVATMMIGAVVAMAGASVPGVVAPTSRKPVVAGRTSPLAIFTPSTRYTMIAGTAGPVVSLRPELRRIDALPAPARGGEQRRFSPAGVAMGMTWASPISVVDNDRFDMRNLRIDRVTGSKIKGPLDAGLMLKITASTRSMDADLGLTGGARMLSDALTDR